MQAIMAASIETVVTVTSESHKYNANTDQDAARATPPKKNKKRLQRYKDSYAQEYAWVTKSRKDQFHAHCRYCTKDISIFCDYPRMQLHGQGAG